MVERQRPSLSVARQCRGAGNQPVIAVLPASGRLTGGSGADEAVRQAVPGEAVLRIPADGYMAAWAGLPHQSEASGPSHGSDGAKSHLSEALDQQAWLGAQGFTRTCCEV